MEIKVVRTLILTIVEHAAKLFRGSQYRLDPDVPISGIIGIALRRALAITRCILRGVGLRPEKWVFVGRGVTLRNRSMIYLGRGVTLGDRVLIDGLSRKGVSIGAATSIGPYTIIEATGVISNLGDGCIIGDRSGIGAYSFIGAAGGVEIGSDVIMGQYVSFHSENHCFATIEKPIREQGVSRQGIVVNDDCWVGAKVTFLDGAHVGRGCVIAAGSVVRGMIPAYSVVAGIPARVIKTRKDEHSA